MTYLGVKYHDVYNLLSKWFSKNNVYNVEINYYVITLSYILESGCGKSLTTLDYEWKVYSYSLYSLSFSAFLYV